MFLENFAEEYIPALCTCARHLQTIPVFDVHLDVIVDYCSQKILTNYINAFY